MQRDQSVVKTLSCMLLCMLHSSWAWSAVHTQPYLAMYSTPKYSQNSVMPYANPQAPKAGMLSRRETGTFDNLNSMNGKGSFAAGVNYLFDSLMSRSLDEPGVMYPLLAEKVSFDPAHSNYVIFHLNPKARFSDGSPVTAEDVKFSFDTYQSKANYGLQTYIADLDKTEVLSKYQVKMWFKSKNNTELPSILAELAIYSKADWKNKDFSRITMQPILGSGPYLIERIDAGRSITYKRNPNYWAKDLPVNRGRYNFNQLKYVYYRSLDIAFEGFKAGQYTFHEEKLTRNWVTGYQFPAVKAGMVTKAKIHLENPTATQSIVFNSRRAPMSDIHLRQALSYAYDFEWLNKAIFLGQLQRLNSYFQNSELAATGKPSAAELQLLQPYLNRLDPLQRQGVLADWKYPTSDASGFHRAGLLSARKILLDAGYRYQNGLLLDRQGKPIKLELMIHQDGLQRSLMPFVRNAKKLGIEINIRLVDIPQYMERTRRYDYDLITLVMPQSLSPGNEQAQMWGSQAADEVGNYNYSGIKNPVIDAVVEQVIRAPNREQLLLQTRILDRLLRAGYYQILTYNRSDTWLAYWSMYQRPQITPKLTTGVDFWWVDPQQAQKVAQYLGQRKR